MLPLKVTTTTTEGTEAVGAKLALAMLEDSDIAPFVALYGDLGVGKTAFVRGLASVIAPNSIVRSPTFALVNEYRAPKSSLFHFDMYRIEDEDDLYAIGFEDYLSRGGYLFLEWSENVREALPSPHITLRIERTDMESGRRITVTGLDEFLR